MSISPSTSLATLRPDLAQSFEAFDLEAQQMGFIAPAVLPFLTVASQAGNYGIIPADQILQSQDDSRAPGSGYNRSTSTFKPGVFACQEHGIEESVDDREAKAYANYFDAESFAARRARDTVLRNLERRVIAKLADITNNFTSALKNTGAISGSDPAGCGTFGASWKTVGSSAPVADVAIMSKAIYVNSGVMPNTMVVSYKKFWDLRRTTAIIDQIKYSGLADPTMNPNVAKQILADLFGVERLLVAGAQYASNKKGATFALSSIWTDGYILLCKTAKSKDFKEMCIGRTFHWQADGSSENGTVESYRDETKRSNIVRVRLDVDEQVIYPKAAYLLTGADA